MREISAVDWPPVTSIFGRAGGRRRLAAAPFQRLGAVKSMAGALAVTGTLLPPACAYRFVDQDHSAGPFPMLWHKAVSRALGVHSELSGTLATGSVLYVCNHISWLDIPVMGSRLKASFVAKAEVGEMGLVGFLADIQETIYVQRERRQQAGAQAMGIQERLKQGDNIILFPEGTSNDGVHVLPFKSSLFAVVEGEGMDKARIQPITIAYTHLNGLPLTRHRMMDIAWVGDMPLGAHALALMRLGRIEATLMCHEPVRRSEFKDRKALARHCHDVISQGYRQLMRGQI